MNIEQRIAALMTPEHKKARGEHTAMMRAAKRKNKLPQNNA